ncbi:MAG TPA: biotin/lipoyl-containing protein [Acidimicrobiales bacterium]|nr:biotin/lipoyl-containing protein [Acidimicrobiales bacterium]
MSADIAMPQLGETVTEGTVTRWFKQVGDEVEEDEVLFEVSTDKVDSEVPSPASGYLAEILVQEGDTVDVGVKLAVISDSPPGGEAEDEEPEGQAEQEDQAEQPEPEPEDDAVEAATKAEQAGAAEGEATKEGAEEAAEPPADAAGNGGGGAPARAETGRPEPARSQQAPAGSGVGGDGVRLLSPVVRRLIAEHGLDPNEIEGTGVGGRITRNDVLAFIDAKGGATTTAAPPAPAPEREEEDKAPARTSPDGGEAPEKERPAAKEAPEGPGPSDRDEVVPFSKIRRRTAEHMRRSIDTSAHTLVVFDVDYDNVDRVRLPTNGR